MSEPDDVRRAGAYQAAKPALRVSASADDQVAVLTLDRPAARNALNRAVVGELSAALTALATRAELRVLVLTGTGDRAFCAGADLHERRTMTPAERTAHTEEIANVADALADFPAPTVAAIRGFALAGGAELAVACDLRIAASDAVFGFPEVAIGIFPGAGGVVRVPRLIGTGAARDLLFTGRQVAVDEAFRLGLVDRVVDADDLVAATNELAAGIARNAPLAVRALKRALIEGTGQPDDVAHRIARGHRRPLDATADYAEGLAAFGERRTARFRGE